MTDLQSSVTFFCGRGVSQLSLDTVPLEIEKKKIERDVSSFALSTTAEEKLL